jgi:hypothetical protein
MKFCAVHNMTDRVCDWMRSQLAPHVEQHFKDLVLATTSLMAPDGRDLIIYLRQGDQHDLNQFVTDYVSVSFPDFERLLFFTLSWLTLILGFYLCYFWLFL